MTNNAASARVRALVADDDADMRSHVSELLAEYAEVDGVASGADAMHALGTRSYDVLLASVALCSADGFTLLRVLRASRPLQRLPIILVSTHTSEDVRAAAIDAGADDYVVMPYVARDLVACVIGALARARAQAESLLADMERQFAERVVALQSAEGERHEILGRLVDAEETERKRLSRELHDQLGQHLTAFALGAADVRRRLEARESPDARLAQLEDLATLMTRDARYLALELRPPELDDVGLDSALATYVDQWRARFGIPADFEVLGERDERPVASDVSTAVYRIAQEALTNVAKHARARHVSVVLDRRASHVRLIVEDDGRGFDYGLTSRQAKRDNRLGLAGMHERAALVGGRLDVETSTSGGTAIYLDVPSSA